MILFILFAICAAGGFGWAPNYGAQWYATPCRDGFRWSPNQGAQWYMGPPIRVPFSGFTLHYPAAVMMINATR